MVCRSTAHCLMITARYTISLQVQHSSAIAVRIASTVCTTSIKRNSFNLDPMGTKIFHWVFLFGRLCLARLQYPSVKYTNRGRKVQEEAGRIDTICDSDTVGKTRDQQSKVLRAEYTWQYRYYNTTTLCFHFGQKQGKALLAETDSITVTARKTICPFT